MGGADFAEAGAGGGAVARWAGWRAAWFVAGGIDAGDARVAGGRTAVRGSRRWRGFGGRDLVGAAAGLVGGDSGNDGLVAFGLSSVGGPAELRGGELPT